MIDENTIEDFIENLPEQTSQELGMPGVFYQAKGSYQSDIDINNLLQEIGLDYYNDFMVCGELEV